MNLFLRLVRLFIASLFSNEKVGLLDQTRLKFRVWFTDQDMFAHMTNSRYLSFADLGTINYILKSGSWGLLRKRGWFPVICGQSMTISRMMSAPQRFEVRSRLVGWDNVYFGMLHEFYSRDRLTAQVKVIARFASRDRSKVSPQQMADLVEPGADNQGLDQDFQRLIDNIEASRQAKPATD